MENKLLQKIKECQKCKGFGISYSGCPLMQVGKGEGQKILVIAESPAKNGWLVSGKACHDSSGKLLATGKRLNEYLSLWGLSIEEVSFTEMSKCFINDRKHLEKTCANCFGFLESQIQEISPKLVITLGVIPNKIFCEKLGQNMPIGKMHDCKKFKYLPLYHPSPANPFGHKKNLEILGKIGDFEF